MGTSTVTYLMCDGLKGAPCGNEIRASREGLLLTGTLHDGGPLKSTAARELLAGSTLARDGASSEVALCAACLAKLVRFATNGRTEAAVANELKIANERLSEKLAAAEAQASSLTTALQQARSARDSAQEELRRERSKSSSSSGSDYYETSWERRGGGPSGPQSPPELEGTPHYVRVASKLTGA